MKFIYHEKYESTKSPNHDGFLALFSQSFWPIVSEKTSTCLLETLNSRVIPENLNNTNIVLIPKGDKPESLGDFRAIFLHSVVYKLVFKVLANNLKSILPTIIFKSPSAFVPS